MTEVDRKRDLLSIVNDLERRVDSVERRNAWDDESDAPPLPPAVDLDFRVREYRARIDYKAVVTWDVVSPNTCQADVDYWVVEFQATNAAGVPREPLKDDDTTPHTYIRNVNNKADVDSPHAIFENVPHPLTWYYRARVRIVDKAHRKGPWSAWVGPFQPADVANPMPPIPTGLNIDYSKVDKDRWDRQQAEVTWDEIGSWDIPGDRSVTVTNATAASNIATYTTNLPHYLEVGDKVEIKNVAPVAYNVTKQVTDVVSPTVFKLNLGSTPANLTNPGIAKLIVDNLPDVSHYQVKFRRCTSGGAALGGTRSRTLVAKDADADTVASTTFEKGVRKGSYYQAKVRAIDRFNRRGEWTAWTTPATPSDTVPPAAPVNVEAYGTIDAVGMDWDAPDDTDDPTQIDQDIAYFQVQMSKTKNFSAIFRRDMFISGTKKEWETEKYKERFWLRVRSKDSSGNHSLWKVAGPVRPVKTKAGRQRVASNLTQSGEGLGIDPINREGYSLFTGEEHQARLTTVTDPASAVIDGENANGLLEGILHTGSVADRIYLGFTLRRSDPNDYLFVALVDVVGTNAIILGRNLNGTFSTMATSSVEPVETESTYALSITLDGTNITVVANGTTLFTHSTSAYQTNTHFGVFKRSGTTRDNGQSRHGSWRYTPETIVVDDAAADVYWGDPIHTWDDAGVTWGGVADTGSTTVPTDVPTIDEDWSGRETAGLGTASSGQTYTVDAGSWETEETAIPNAIIGASVIMPVMTLENFTPADINVPADGVRLLGSGGSGAGPLEFYLDRPTRLMGDAFITLGNRSGSETYNCRVWVIFVVDGLLTYGRGTSQFFAADGTPVNKWQNVAVYRNLVIPDASLDNPVLIQAWIGLRNDTGTNKSMTFREFVMRVWNTYAPDVSTSFDPLRRPSWTRTGVTRRSYRTITGEDT